MLEIRHVTNDDRSFWFSLDSHLSESEFDLKVRDNRGYVIRSENEKIGIMRYNLFWDTIPFLTLIYLSEKNRGKGFGRLAMTYWENDMRSLGYNTVMTSTQADEQAQHFYRKLGYFDRGGIVFNGTPIEQPLEIIMLKVI